MTDITPIGVLIIGGGPAGLAAALAAREAGAADILILERERELGGILRQCVHTGFGLHVFKEELTGPEYAARYVSQVREQGIPFQCDTTVIDITRDRLATCVSAAHGLQQFQAGAIVLAMGCRERPRGALGIPGTRSAGIFSAGTAQRFVNLDGFMPGRQFVILGSGDIGLIMARRLTFAGARVEAVVELMPYSSGLKRNIVQCLDDFGIPLLLSHTVTAIHGQERLAGVTVNQVDEDLHPVPGTERHFPCDTLLLSVGLIPENELSRQAGVDLDAATGGPVVDDGLQTSVAGIFACGNVLHVHDLVDHVSAEAAEAGRQAARFTAAARRPDEPNPPALPGGAAPPAGTPADATAIDVRDGEGIRGIVPQRIRRDALMSGPVKLMFRPTAVRKNAVLALEADGVAVHHVRKRVLAPGEMVELTIRPEYFTAGRPTRELRVRCEDATTAP